jgi:hypothetical protein
LTEFVKVVLIVAPRRTRSVARKRSKKRTTPEVFGKSGQKNTDRLDEADINPKAKRSVF